MRITLLTVALFSIHLPLQAGLDAYSVEAAVKRTADWHLAHPNESQSSLVGLREWHMAPLYDGLFQLAMLSGESKYLSEIVRAGELVSWTPGRRQYHADDQAVGHTWLDVYLLDRNQTGRLLPMKERFDGILSGDDSSSPWGGSTRSEHRDGRPRIRWDWCDALYMEPPTLVRLYAATGDEAYLDFMETEWKVAHEHLYDEEDGLYFRDLRYPDQRTKNGKKVIWSRGNGWVYGGLAQVLNFLPEDHPSRSFYEQVFLEMSDSLKGRQHADGLWYPNLDDHEHIEVGEASGTGFILYGMAWGIRKGFLSKDEYWPVIEKGWEGLLSCIQPDGMLGYVQPVGAEPVDNVVPDMTHTYGTGAFLLAGTEIMRILGRVESMDSRTLLAEAEEDAFDEFGWEALAVFEPDRVDDIAWENDKMAFRVYGSALRDSTEDSGIDCWMKRVPYPIVRKWYEKELSGAGSYHVDTGEGYDGYKVGSLRGCGGTALWEDGKMVTSNVWIGGDVLWSRRDQAAVELMYRYPNRVFETKTITLSVGDDFCEVESRFWTDQWGNTVPDLSVAVGLTAQTEGAEIEYSREKGWLSVWDVLGNGDAIGTAVLIDEHQPEEMFVTGSGTNREVVTVLKTDEDGKIRYRMGFKWIKADKPKNAAEWISFIASDR